MYAHQVIDSLNNTLVYSDDDLYKPNAARLTHSIAGAHKFHVGDFKDVYETFMNNLKGKRAFLSPETSDFIRLPYDKCWFDFQNTKSTSDENIEKVNVPKRGVLTESTSKDTFVAWVFNCHDDLTLESIYGSKRKGISWVPSPLCYFVNIGKEVDHDFVTSTLKSNPQLKSIPAVIYTKENNKPSNIFALPVGRLAYEQLGKHEVTQLLKDDNDDIACLNVALMLLNCQNIGTENVEPPLNLNKKRGKKRKAPLFSYKTLIVKPTGKDYQSVPKGLWNNRIHFCRGHFKTYTKDAPLFGRFTGRYWWQPHTRGRNTKGVVHKDYKIEKDGR